MKKFISLLTAVAISFIVVACSSNKTPDSTQEHNKQTIVGSSGETIEIPENVEKVVVLAPSIAEVLVELGFSDKIVAYDANSKGIPGLPTDAEVFDLMNPNIESLMALQPDVLFVSSMTLYDQTNPFEQLENNGTTVVCIPSSESIAGIQNDIKIIAQVMSAQAKGDEINQKLKSKLDEIAQIGKKITEKKKVYFEISPAPEPYSFGAKTFLNEMIEIIGAENILANQDGWLPVDVESVIQANPDVIFTNVNYMGTPEDAENEIKKRDGWENVSAVKNGDVYYIDNMASSLPNQNIVIALEQMAKAIYPEYYENMK